MKHRDIFKKRPGGSWWKLCGNGLGKTSCYPCGAAWPTSGPWPWPSPGRAWPIPSRLSATASVFCYVGHKEDSVVKEVSERLAAALGAKVVVAAGLHWDNLQPEGIRQVQENVRALVEMIVREERMGGGHG